MLRDIYARAHSLQAVIVRHFDNAAPGTWSHCGAIVDAATPIVVESRPFMGVVLTPLDEFVARYTRTEIVEYEVPEPAAGNEWALGQIGCGYDYLAVLGRLFRRSWDEPNRWHCRELCEARLAVAGRRRFRASPSRITPNIGYMTL